MASLDSHAARRRSASRRGTAALAALLCTVSGWWQQAAAQPTAEPEPVDVVGRSGRPLDGGGSATEFSLRLPSGAACPGDSANDGYRVNSYMVPVGVHPSTVIYNGLGPTPPVLGDGSSFRQPLYDTETHPFVSAQTAEARAPGEPGPIVNVPVFSFAVYAPGDLPPGRYHVGLVCTLLNVVVSIWDTEMILSVAREDDPAQVTWTVSDAEAAGGSTPTAALVGLAVAAALALTINRLRRRRSLDAVATVSLEDR